ncbi:MAG TPA: NAD(P)/FAD-dependent oxidoreductase, partial [Enteractinococcus sp.]
MSHRAIVVGSGPNGLTAAALLARHGWQVDVYERNAIPGGAAASSPVLGPGTVVDMGAAGHPFGVASPAFRALELTSHGLEWVQTEVPMAHPLPHGEAAVLHRDLDTTAEALDKDARRWTRVHRNLTRHIDEHLQNLLGPMLRMPAHPLRLARFGPVAVAPASFLTKTIFSTEAARALFLGSAAHAIVPLTQPFTGAFGALFGVLGMSRGWPVVRGGTGQLVKA